MNIQRNIIILHKKMRNLNPAFSNNLQVNYIVFKMTLDNPLMTSTFMKLAY